MSSGRSSACSAFAKFGSAGSLRTATMFGCSRHLRTCSPRDDDCWQRREDPREIPEETRSGMKSGQKPSTGRHPDGPWTEFIVDRRFIGAVYLENPGKSDLP